MKIFKEKFYDLPSVLINYDIKDFCSTVIVVVVVMFEIHLIIVIILGDKILYILSKNKTYLPFNGKVELAWQN